MIGFFSKFCAGLYNWFQKVDYMPKFYTWSASSGFIFFVIATTLNLYKIFIERKMVFGPNLLFVHIILLTLNAIYQYKTDYNNDRSKFSVLTTKFIFFGSATLYLITILAVGR